VAYLRSPLWRLRRRIWIIRALGRCEHCGRRRQLTIHHRTYQRLGHESRSDIAVLCWRCHQLEHPRRQQPRAWVQITSLTRRPLAGRPWSAHRRARLPSRVVLLVLIALPAVLLLVSRTPHR
jgi:hypothetical protein